MAENTERRKSVISTAAKAGGLYGSEKAAEITLRRKGLRALDKVAKSLIEGFLSREEIEEKLGFKSGISRNEK